MSLNAKTEFERDALLKRIREMEEEIARLDQELTQSNRLATLGILAGMIAHEFNNLLTPVMSYSQLAANSPDDQKLVQKAMSRTVEGTERLAHIASSILGFMRDDRQLQSCDIRTVVNEALTCLVRQPEKHGIRVVRQIPAGLRAEIRPVALQQVLLNLFLNAIRSMEEQGGGELRIEAGLDVGNDGNEVFLSIADTGPGVSDAVIARVFGPPITPESTNRSNNGGSGGAPDESDPARHGLVSNASGNGLGLAVCQRLIQEAGGLIEVQNRPANRGAVFHLHLNEAIGPDNHDGLSS